MVAEKRMPAAPARPVASAKPAPVAPVRPARPPAAVPPTPAATRPRPSAPLPPPPAIPQPTAPLVPLAGIPTGKGWRGVASLVAGLGSVAASPLPMSTTATFDEPAGYAGLFAGVVLAGLGILFAALQSEKGESKASRRGLWFSLAGAALSIAFIVLDQWVIPR